ncbi:MAG: histidine phosphatase family protein [Burkholderiaceae bacterium]|jgi:broad specificity phosphatase PhoE|nr:histidine phosphatase family protein [Burkholderiaceae bacterium]
MGTIYLVRHGQASFGADDYDQLSDLGVRQSERLGQYWRARFGEQLRFDAVLTGTLRRQAQTWQAIADGAGLAHKRIEWPGLNEYNGEAIIRALHPGPLPKPDTPERYREHFRLLREGLARWIAGQITPEGMPSWRNFASGVMSALNHVRAHHAAGVTLIVSSGGPIATAVGQLLGASPEAIIEMNLRIRNTGVTELACTPRRCALVSYNTLPHLNDAVHAGWITHT